MAMTTERMRVDRATWQQGLDRREDGIDNFRAEREQNEDLHRVVGVGTHPRSFSGHHNDRWILFSAAYLRAL